MGDEPLVRLRDEFREGFEFRRGMGEEFRRWGRYQRGETPEDRVTIAPQYWRPLHTGQGVPEHVMQWFAEFASWKLEERYLVSEIAEASGAESDGPPLTDTLGWANLLQVFAKHISMPDEAYCSGDEDIELVVRSVLEAVGETRTLTGEMAVCRGEEIMGRKRDEYAQMLHVAHRVDQRTVLFGTWHDGKALHRVSVGVVIPVTKSFYGGFRDGRFDDLDIDRKVIQSPSKHLHVNAGAKLRLEGVPGTIVRAKRSLADSTSVLWQLASLCPSALRSFPRMVSFGGTEKNEQRLRAYDFIPTGARTPRTNKEVFELRPPNALAPTQIGRYGAMLALLLLFQSYINGQSLFDD